MNILKRKKDRKDEPRYGAGSPAIHSHDNVAAANLLNAALFTSLASEHNTSYDSSSSCDTSSSYDYSSCDSGSSCGSCD